VIYKGVPGGVLGWNPTVDTRTGVAVTALPAIDRDRVQTNSSRGSRATAESYVERLEFAATSTRRRHHDEAKRTTPTTRRSTTPTTKAPTTKVTTTTKPQSKGP